MTAAQKLPPHELALTAAECADLWAMSPEWWLRTVACHPDFPERISRKPAAWIAGEVLEYRRTHRA